MANLGFLGCGKIGKSMIDHIRKNERHKITFIQSRSLQEKEAFKEKIITKPADELYKNTDIIIESATADALKENIDEILKYSDLVVFSVTAFSDEKFTNKVKELCQKYNRHVYFPHGAILGLDGIFDARPILKSVTIETIKSPQSLGRTDKERTIVYEGVTREVCKLYPRNVNVHAAIALAGLGFDKTLSKIISDPATTNNTHIIQVEGEGISFTLNLSSFSTGGVTGAYTPISACGSLDRILGGDLYYSFI
ncbi:aspartate dehydrogenase domain-containing protein [Fusobacterium sp. PH5-44]|uniref:aspartate dehydrogenase domain-containing protein n=1 Tax=unclassified Fusobacterium TaxID=2648384 RepID=UPI003D22CD35